MRRSRAQLVGTTKRSKTLKCGGSPFPIMYGARSGTLLLSMPCILHESVVGDACSSFGTTHVWPLEHPASAEQPEHVCPFRLRGQSQNCPPTVLVLSAQVDVVYGRKHPDQCLCPPPTQSTSYVSAVQSSCVLYGGRIIWSGADVLACCAWHCSTPEAL